MNVGPPARDTGTHRLEVLDLLRGVAAMAVLILHSGENLGMAVLPNAYLAVDLFFVLSGFVIAHSYDQSIRRGMTLGEFLLARGIRLFPCYWLGLALGLVLASARMIRDAGYVDATGLLAALGANLIIAPALVPLYGISNPFPFNGASWSLMYEVVINIVYWFIGRFLSIPSMIILLMLSATGLSLAAIQVGTVDVGMRSHEWWFASERVMFSFFAGVALRRYAYDRIKFTLGQTGIGLAVALLVLMFVLPAALGWRKTTELIAVFGVFPLLTVCASRAAPGAQTREWCRVLGSMSYPMYILQTPLLLFFAAIPQIFFHTKAIHWAPWLGIVQIVTICWIAWLVDQHFDLPIRRAMRASLMPRPQTVRAVER